MAVPTGESWSATIDLLLMGSGFQLSSGLWLRLTNCLCIASTFDSTNKILKFLERLKTKSNNVCQKKRSINDVIKKMCIPLVCVYHHHTLIENFVFTNWLHHTRVFYCLFLIHNYMFICSYYYYLIIVHVLILLMFNFTPLYSRISVYKFFFFEID